MAVLNFSNLLRKDVQQLYGTTDTRIEISNITGLPATPFRAVWYDKKSYPNPVDDPKAEIIEVTSATTFNLTINRGNHADLSDENSSNHTHNMVGGEYVISPVVTAGFLNNLPGYDSVDDEVVSPNNFRVKKTTGDPALIIEREADTAGAWCFLLNSNNYLELKRDTSTPFIFQAGTTEDTRLQVDETDDSGDAIVHARILNTSNTLGDVAVKFHVVNGPIDWTLGIDQSEGALKLSRSSEFGADDYAIFLNSDLQFLMDSITIYPDKVGGSGYLRCLGTGGNKYSFGIDDANNRFSIGQGDSPTTNIKFDISPSEARLFTPKFTLYDNDDTGIGVLEFGSAGATITSGSDTPTSGEPNGSIYLRTGAEGELWMMDNSTWTKIGG